MEQIVLFDTSLGTKNQGDYVIKEAIDQEMSYLFRKNVILRVPTHYPVGRGYQVLFGDIARSVSHSELKFLCGTNLFKFNICRPNRDWNIGVIDQRLYRRSISLGCGVEINAAKMTNLSRALYRGILSKDYAHSVRDERTKLVLNQMGFDAINTGCPTTWNLTQDTVEKAFNNRSETVLFTLTDYAKDKVADMELFRTLKRHYREIMFWPQGSEDYRYANELGILGQVQVLPASFDAYRELQVSSFEYVGTRLHGGIYALAHGHRTTIIAVDHRALDVGKTTGLKVIPRNSNLSVSQAICDLEPPHMTIPTKEIERWKRQFK